MKAEIKDEVKEEKGEIPASLAMLPASDSLTARERTLSASQGSLKSIPDNDSSATLSADEGPPARSDPLGPKIPGEGRGDGGGEQGRSMPGQQQQLQQMQQPAAGMMYPHIPPVSLTQAPPPSKPGDKPAAAALSDKDKQRKSPACVRDLIHSAIERNLQQPESDMAARASEFTRYSCLTF